MKLLERCFIFNFDINIQAAKFGFRSVGCEFQSNLGDFSPHCPSDLGPVKPVIIYEEKMDLKLNISFI